MAHIPCWRKMEVTMCIMAKSEAFSGYKLHLPIKKSLSDNKNWVLWYLI
jgi:hypothetical protein